MSDSDNTQLPSDTPQEEEKETPHETPDEEETVIPTTKAKAKRKPKEPKNKSKEIVISLEPTEYFDDQKPLTLGNLYLM